MKEKSSARAEIELRQVWVGHDGGFNACWACDSDEAMWAWGVATLFMCDSAKGHSDRVGCPGCHCTMDVMIEINPIAINACHKHGG